MFAEWPRSSPARDRGRAAIGAPCARSSGDCDLILFPTGSATISNDALVTSPPLPLSSEDMTKKDTFRIVTRASDGSFLIRDYPNCEPLLKTHLQIGIDDCSTDLGLRGMPVFRGLIGPIPEGKSVVRYESPEVFEVLTKEWGAAKPRKRRRRTSRTAEAAS